MKEHTSTYIPDTWVLLKISSEQYGDIYKVLAGWYGGYTSGDSWKLSSGAKTFVDKEYYYESLQDSGSTYVLYKQAKKFSGYTQNIYDSFVRQANDIGCTIEVVSAESVLDIFNVG